MTKVHTSAIVDAGAELADSVEVGPYAVIGPGVQIGEGTVVGSHCTIGGPTTIGRNNVIHAHASLGGAPQDMKYRGEPTQLVIGDGNTIFEFCTFSRGTVQDAGVTRIGNANWLMAYVHIAHDVQVGDHTVMASYAALAGHAQLGDWAIIGGMTGVHQFCKVGAHVITGFQSHVGLDIPPFMMASGNPLSVYGFNLEGLRRRGFSRERIANIKQMHRLLYRDGLTLSAAQEAIAALRGQAPSHDGESATGDAAERASDVPADGSGGSGETDQDVQALLDFLASAKRGIAR